MSTPPDQMDPRGQQAATVRQPKRWPLVQTYSSRNGTLVQDAYLGNAYAEMDPVTQQWNVEKRPALNTLTAAIAGGNQGAGTGITIVAAGGANLAVCITAGNVFSSVTPLTGLWVKVASTLGTLGQLKFGQVSGATNYLLYSGSDFKYSVLTGATIGTPTAVAAQPWGAGNLSPGIGYLDGTTYLMDLNGFIYGSNLFDPTTFNALNVIQAASTPDYAIALATHLTYVVAFKEWSTNIFYDAGNPTGSPLSPVPDAQIPYGCFSALSVQEVDGSLIWITRTSNTASAPQIGMLSNLTFSIISTPPVERMLISWNASAPFSSADVVDSWVLKIAGHRFYGIDNHTKQQSLVLDLDQRLWLVWSDTVGNAFPVTGMAGGYFQSGNTTLAQDPATGLPIQLLPDYVQGYDLLPSGVLAVPTVDIYTPSFDGGTRRKKQLNFMFFNANKYPGNTLKSRWNDNDYDSKSWSNFRTIDLSANTPVLPSNGTFRRRAYHWQHRCPTPLRLSSVELQMDLGTL